MRRAVPANGRLPHLLTLSFLLDITLHVICCPAVNCTSDWVQGTASLLTVSTQSQWRLNVVAAMLISACVLAVAAIATLDDFQNATTALHLLFLWAGIRL